MLISWQTAEGQYKRRAGMRWVGSKSSQQKAVWGEQVRCQEAEEEGGQRDRDEVTRTFRLQPVVE